MFSVLQARSRSADSLLTDNDSGLDSLQKNITHRTPSSRHRHNPGSLNSSPLIRDGNRTGSNWNANSVHVDTDTGGKSLPYVRHKSVSQQQINGTSSSFGLFGRGSVPAQPRMGIAGSLYNKKRPTCESPHLLSSSPVHHVHDLGRPMYGEQPVKTSIKKIKVL